ncbi:AbrB family transcriptional regulator [Aestuariirhabdus litorea]|uniref:AbrB family transcriptional regulator n=1 Tax=Aestuariirhabdus litorea TaxID=2528527 RepID=A0A3P3VPB6_9GAMM|nr:AbrB family transcriptional regulator [Aestuariirhabdus litorea]RRJ84197.1 AbrB family transcriptional regulator [Aestuariirhabdus litorea]RWW97418.1 AbrB family transcriptional regulator [Endozoicomonadaceae bacterium GTF-13]
MERPPVTPQTADGTQPPTAPTRYRWILVTLATGVAGGALAQLLGLPSGWLLGPLFLVLAGVIGGLPLQMPSATAPLIGLLLGISIASSINHRLLEQLPHWGISLALMLLMLACLMSILYLYYRRRCLWRREDALLSAIPGNLAIIMMFALESGLRAERIAFVHSVRLIFLVSCLPLIFPLQPVATTGLEANIPSLTLLVTLVAAFLCGRLAAKLRAPAPMLVGGLLATLLARFGLGWEVSIPPLLFTFILLLLGTSLGARLAGIDLKAMIPVLGNALVGLVVTLCITTLFALLLSTLLGVPLLQALLAYAPGGIEVMIAIALSLDVDATFVAGHQITRMLLMSALLPLMLAWAQRYR